MLVKGSFEKARLYIESRSKSSEQDETRLKQGPCITISRETGSGADFVSDELLKILKPLDEGYEHQWAVFNKNLIERVIADHHLPEKLSRYFVEDKLSELKSTVNELLGIHPHSWVLVKKTTHTILQLAQIGNVIIVGRGGNIITYNMNNTFHVRLVAPMRNKVKRIQERFELTRKDAIEYIEKEDIARRNYVKKYFSKNINDLSLYHIVINTGFMSYKKAAKSIAEIVKETYPELFPQNIFTSQYDYA